MFESHLYINAANHSIGDITTMITKPIAAGPVFRTEVYTGGKNEAPFTDLGPSEIDAINACLDMGIEHFNMVSPKLARIIEPQREDFFTWAGFAKAAMDDKVIGFPSKPGGLGVTWITPQSIYRSATDDTQYNGWETNSNEVELVAGTPKPLFGDIEGTVIKYYKSYNQMPERSFSVIAKDGLIEIGSTPSFRVQRIYTESDTQYGVIAEPPTNILPIEKCTSLYVHKTIGQVPLWYDLGIRWEVLPIKSCTATIIPIGLTFYEHSFMPTLEART